MIPNWNRNYFKSEGILQDEGLAVAYITETQLQENMFYDLCDKRGPSQQYPYSWYTVLDHNNRR